MCTSTDYNFTAPTSDDGQAAEGHGNVPLVAEGPGVVIYAAAPGGEEEHAAHQAQHRVLDNMEMRNRENKSRV